MLLAEPAELARDDLPGDPFAREGRGELVHRPIERSRILAQRVDERRGTVRREVEPPGARALEQPTGQLLAHELDLGHRADALDELDERRRRLRPIADDRDQDQWRLGIWSFEVPRDLANAVLG